MPPPQMEFILTTRLNPKYFIELVDFSFNVLLLLLLLLLLEIGYKSLLYDENKKDKRVQRRDDGTCGHLEMFKRSPSFYRSPTKAKAQRYR
ncbi:hypothetical protein M0802_008121 [Mischocyttarus mexicanus]|nr:hypothetical protein M0802_008121 [Mischocyttarus mexicanus]